MERDCWAISTAACILSVFGEVSVYSNTKRNAALCTVGVENHGEQEAEVALQIKRPGKDAVTLSKSVRTGTTAFHLELTDVPNWDEYTPNLEDVQVLLESGESVVDEKSFQIGLRSVETKGKHIFVNGKQLFLRGTVECCVFPKTGHPPMEEGYWEYLFFPEQGIRVEPYPFPLLVSA